MRFKRTGDADAWTSCGSCERPVDGFAGGRAGGDSAAALGVWLQGAFLWSQSVEDGSDGQVVVSACRGAILLGVRDVRLAATCGPDHAAYRGRAARGEAGVRIRVRRRPGVDDRDVRRVQAHGYLADDGHGQAVVAVGAASGTLVALLAGGGPGFIRSKRCGASASRGRSSFVRGEFSLTALAYNLRRAINLVGVSAMVAAASA